MSSEATLREEATVTTAPFKYLAPAGNGEPANGDPEGPWTVPEPLTHADVQKIESAAFERGIVEGENREKGNCELQLRTCKEAIGKAVDAFRNEREEYFNRIEPEVVQLALAIARKILHRESQIDPLLLTGLVHVALEKLDAGARVRLRVHPADTHFWNEFFARSGWPQTPELAGDPSLPHGACTLETEIGSTEISMQTQLKEIEQGFFDLLEQRPKVR